MIKNVWLMLIIWNGMFLLSGCLSVMLYIGGKEGIYSGMCVSVMMIGNDEINWGIKLLVILDMLFIVVMDMIFLLWDIFCKDSLVRLCVEKSEEEMKMINVVIFLVKMFFF